MDLYQSKCQHFNNSVRCSVAGKVAQHLHCPLSFWHCCCGVSCDVCVLGKMVETRCSLSKKVIIPISDWDTKIRFRKDTRPSPTKTFSLSSLQRLDFDLISIMHRRD